MTLAAIAELVVIVALVDAVYLGGLWLLLKLTGGIQGEEDGHHG